MIFVDAGYILPRVNSQINIKSKDVPVTKVHNQSQNALLPISTTVTFVTNLNYKLHEIGDSRYWKRYTIIGKLILLVILRE